MEIFKDIRMEIVDEESAMDYMYSLGGKWIYIQHVNRLLRNQESCQTTSYYKFKVKSVCIKLDYIYIYGDEDKDLLAIDKNGIDSYQMTVRRDELYIQNHGNQGVTDIYIRDYIPNAKNRLNEVLETDKNIIITEGKTDWKHLKRALSYFQSKGMFKDFNFSFFEYEDDVKMGATSLLKVLEYNQLFYSEYKKVFVFDADRKDINKKHNNREYVDWGNNVFSFVIPVPEFRVHTPLISIENYYSDEVLGICDKNGRRLYINHEFDEETGTLKNDKRIYDINHGKNKKMPPNHIIDAGVFCVPETMEINAKNAKCIKDKCSSIALTKNCFANNILNSEEGYDNIDFSSFKDIFDILLEIQRLSEGKRVVSESRGENEIELCQGVYVEEFDNKLKCMKMYITETEQTLKIKADKSLLVDLEVKGNVLCINLENMLEHIVTIAIPLSVELIKFLEAKCDNRYNRMEVYFVNNESTRQIEILKGDFSSVLIQRALSMM